MPNAKRQEFQEVMPAYVEAPVNYLADLSVTPVTYNPPAGTGIPKRVGNYRDFPVRIADGRPFAADMSLDRQAFRLVRHDTEVHDFYDTEEVKTRYYAEVEALIKRETGASKVVIFDHTIRRRHWGSRTGRRASRASRSCASTAITPRRRARSGCATSWAQIGRAHV